MTPTDLLWEAESEILLAIARHLRAGNIASADWKTDRLQKLGALTNETASILKRYRDGILSGTMSEIEKAAMDRLLRSEKIMAQAKARGASLFSPLPPEADPVMHGIILAWQESAVDQMNLAMATMLEKAGQTYVATINRTTLQVLTGAMSGREALVSTVKEWAASGIPSIVDRAGRQWTTEAYSNMVIRTNTTRVATEVQFKRAEEYGADLIEVSSHAGARPLCAPYQGKIFSISGKSEKYPPLSSTSYGEPAGLFGINCVLGETLVSGPGKRAIYRRKYSGEIIIIRTSGGHELSVTPNHPILTENGWVAAGLLKEGDNVICSARFDRENSTSPDPNHSEARIEDVFNSCLESGDVFRLPASSGYFHGDVSDGDIDVVLPHSFLNDWAETSFFEHNEKSPLGFAAESSDSLAGISAFNQVAFGPGHTPNSVMGGSGIPLAPLGSGPLLSDSRCLGSVTGERDAESFEVLPNCAFRNSDSSSNLVLPHARIVHSEEAAGADSRLPLQVTLPVSLSSIHSVSLQAINDRMQGTPIFIHDCPSLDPGSIKLDNVVLVERKPAQSSFIHVYNLETETGWYYANDIITHNCGHLQYPFFEGMSRQTHAPTGDAEENAEQYQESQKQRAIERSIRAAKRELGTIEALGDQKAIAEAKSKVRERQAVMRDFIAETGRTRQRAREQVYD